MLANHTRYTRYQFKMEQSNQQDEVCLIPSSYSLWKHWYQMIKCSTNLEHNNPIPTWTPHESIQDDWHNRLIHVISFDVCRSVEQILSYSLERMLSDWNIWLVIILANVMLSLLLLLPSSSTTIVGMVVSGKSERTKIDTANVPN